jgi:hypothetical protein
VMGPLEELTQTLDLSRSSFRNVVFSSDLELRAMDKVQKLGDSESRALFLTTPFKKFYSL